MSNTKPLHYNSGFKYSLEYLSSKGIVCRIINIGNMVRDTFAKLFCFSFATAFFICVVPFALITGPFLGDLIVSLLALSFVYQSFIELRDSFSF